MYESVLPKLESFDPSYFTLAEDLLQDKQTWSLKKKREYLEYIEK